eukprot:16490-Karenia_brevis.AAC.1
MEPCTATLHLAACTCTTYCGRAMDYRHSLVCYVQQWGQGWAADQEGGHSHRLHQTDTWPGHHGVTT